MNQKQEEQAMYKSNYFATIYQGKKKIASRRVHFQEIPAETRLSQPDRREYVYFQKSLWNVEDLLKDGYKVMYQYIPSHGSFPILDVALSVPFERVAGQRIW